ncbi:hypothetical protein [Scytonema sp. PRP1]|uniref:hypothetical protein n=1 Tax=Scytonema sp. PRP1 TaxID=3120513 RepID=UPI00300C90FE
MKGNADPVEATELANLLTGKGIPVCLLNACQSGKQVKPNPPPPSLQGKGEGGEEGDFLPPLVGEGLGERLIKITQRLVWVVS